MNPFKDVEHVYHDQPAIEFNLQGDIRLRDDIDPKSGEYFIEFATDYPPIDHVTFTAHRRVLRRGALIVSIPIRGKEIQHEYRTYIQIKE